MLNYGQQINHSPIVLAVIELLDPMQRTQIQQCIKGTEQTMLSNHHRIPCAVIMTERQNVQSLFCAKMHFSSTEAIMMDQQSDLVKSSTNHFKSTFFCYHPSATGQQKKQKKKPQKKTVSVHLE